MTPYEKQSLDYINKYYGLNVKDGDYVKFDGDWVRVVGARGAHLTIKYKNGARGYIHPTWNVEYKQQEPTP